MNSSDAVADCHDNSKRYAGMAMLYTHRKSCWLDSGVYGAYHARNDLYVYPANGFVAEELWMNMKSPGFRSESAIADLHSVLVFRNAEAQDAGWTLPANDTLTIWTALAVIRDAASTAAGLDSLKGQIDRAKRWLVRSDVLDRCTLGCCQRSPDGRTGDVNYDGRVNSIDLAMLIAYLTPPPGPVLPCHGEADVNSSGLIGGGLDLAVLIAYLTPPPGPVLPQCRSGS